MTKKTERKPHAKKAATINIAAIASPVVAAPTAEELPRDEVIATKPFWRRFLGWFRL